jgi:tetratricopeptide (TPR) repeat protein
VVSQQQEQFQEAYQAGRDALERGQYRLSVEHLETAKALVAASSLQGGEAQMWLVTAYQAAGRLQEARNLCQQLTKHPHLDIRKQSKAVLYILDAPQLKRSPDWLSQIPAVDNLSDSAPRYQQGANVAKKSERITAETGDLSEVNAKDNYFIWVALVAVMLALGAAVWFSQS